MGTHPHIGGKRFPAGRPKRRRRGASLPLRVRVASDEINNRLSPVLTPVREHRVQWEAEAAIKRAKAAKRATLAAAEILKLSNRGSGENSRGADESNRGRGGGVGRPGRAAEDAWRRFQGF